MENVILPHIEDGVLISVFSYQLPAVCCIPVGTVDKGLMSLLIPEPQTRHHTQMCTAPENFKHSIALFTEIGKEPVQTQLVRLNYYFTILVIKSLSKS